MRAFVVLFCLIMFDSVCQRLHAAPDPGMNCPLRLTLNIDRQEYLPQEPMIVEWSISNSGDRTVTFPEVDPHKQFAFQYQVQDRRAYQLRTPGLGCGSPEFVKLDPNETHRGWYILQQVFAGMPESVAFTLRPTCNSAYYFTSIEQAVPCALSAKEFIVKIVPSDGQDLAAHKLIKKLMSEQFPRFVGKGDPPEPE